MAKFNQGILGAFQGRIGKVIGSSWKGIPYMKVQPKKRGTPPTERELLNRKKWAMSQHWLKPVALLEFVRIGFKGYSLKSEGFIAAKSHLLKNAFEGSDSELVINPALVKLSSGDLPLPSHISAVKIDEKRIQFTWDPTTVEGSDDCDQIMMLAYNIEKMDAECITTGQLRKTGSDILARPFRGTVHLYAAFVAADRSRQSDSVYLGAITV